MRNQYFKADTKAVSSVIGTLMAFMIFVSLITLFQVTAVPIWNADVENEHFDVVYDDFSKLRTDIGDVMATSFPKSSVIHMGAKYPSRIFLYNPPPTTGSLKISPDKWMNLTYTQISDGQITSKNFSASTVTFKPNYQYAHSQEIVYEHGILFKNYTLQGYNYTESQQTLTDGSSVYALWVNSSETSFGSQESKTINVYSVSSPSNSILVSNVSIRMKTSYAKWWNSTLNEIDGVSASIESDDIVNITFASNTPLMMGEAYLSIGDEDIPNPGASCLVKVSGDGASVPAGTTQQLIAEARDRYNNPVSDVRINFTVISGGGGVSPSSAITGTDGRATTTLTTAAGVNKVNASSSGIANVTFTGEGGAPVPSGSGCSYMAEDGMWANIPSSATITQFTITEISFDGLEDKPEIKFKVTDVDNNKWNPFQIKFKEYGDKIEKVHAKADPDGPVSVDYNKDGMSKVYDSVSGLDLLDLHNQYSLPADGDGDYYYKADYTDATIGATNKLEIQTMSGVYYAKFCIS